MKCPYCSLVVGETYRCNGESYCRCGEAFDTTGKFAIYSGKQGDKHAFRMQHSVKCSCGKRLDTVLMPCYESDGMREAEAFFGIRVKQGATTCP